ncbi:MAG: hypothetical protein ACLFQA_10810 [Bacteroidales bacterium]
MRHICRRRQKKDQKNRFYNVLCNLRSAGNVRAGMDELEGDLIMAPVNMRNEKTL